MTGKDLENTLIFADERGMVHEAVVKGRRIPFKMNVEYEVHDIYNLKTEDDKDWVVSRANYTNVTLEDFKALLQHERLPYRRRTRPDTENLRKGHLALLTTFYEASGRLQPPSKAALRSLGSWAAPHLKFRDYWAWAWRVGGATLGEALVSSPQSILDAPAPVHLHLDVDLHVNSSASGRFCREWPQDDLWKKRSYFCDLYDGYGDLCSCDDPFLPGSAPPRMDTWREEVAVVIVAGSRPRYLYRLLRQLLTQPGMTSDLVLVSVDGEDEETVRLLEVLELRFFLHTPEGSLGSTKISSRARELEEATPIPSSPPRDR
ncbi:protein O-linked-mannose beta-1,2-N-acetylglucosaminyltransferase 1-like [Penaeus chinensis]|uniref:protein O-linked-mannose beta-1,2-N-acetylglucosaminyltransferase 1-like n=1 Tax=Penaeus chinensis TaxID=139456 RepID=UPI001FB74395|nr:protein O-linked-mannose beta-1,2-N-acetylglucosaminyltransferase 1-like [Penaeus chinensis]